MGFGVMAICPPLWDLRDRFNVIPLENMRPISLNKQRLHPAINSLSKKFQDAVRSSRTLEGGYLNVNLQ